MNKDEEEVKFLDVQAILTWVFLGAAVISLILVSNARKKVHDEEPFLSSNQVRSISVTTRFILLIVTIYAAYVNYKEIDHLKRVNKSQADIDAANLEFWASALAAISALLLLIAALKAENIDLIGADII